MPTLLHDSQHLRANGENYKTWRMQVGAILSAYGLMEEFEYYRITSVNVALELRRRWGGSASLASRDNLAKAIILINVQTYDVFRRGELPSFTRATFEKASAHHIWSYLEEQFIESED